MRKAFAVPLFLGFCFGQPLIAADRKVVVLRSSALPFYVVAAKGFAQCLKSKAAGATLVDLMLSENQAEQDRLLNGIKGQAPALVVTMGSSATRLAREKLAGLPKIFCMVMDPASNNLTGGGVSMDLKPSAQVGLIKKYFPQFKRIGVIYNPVHKDTDADLRELAARETSVRMVLVEVSGAAQMDAAVSGLKGKADCLLMVSDPVLYSAQSASQLILSTLQMPLPLVAMSPAYVKAGALLGIYADYEDNGCMAADLAARALSGESPDGLPVLWPTKTKVSVNLVVADRLGINVGQSLIDSAEEVVK